MALPDRFYVQPDNKPKDGGRNIVPNEASLQGAGHHRNIMQQS